jgi:hypothetical protein
LAAALAPLVAGMTAARASLLVRIPRHRDRSFRRIVITDSA